MNNNLASELAKEILEALNREFSFKHLSNNLLNNVKIIETNDYVELRISAPSYDFYEYFINGVIVPPKRAGLPTQYASLLDTQGSEYTVYWREGTRGNIHKKKQKPHNHIGYVNKVLSEGISSWTSKQNLQIKVDQ